MKYGSYYLNIFRYVYLEVDFANLNIFTQINKDGVKSHLGDKDMSTVHVLERATLLICALE